MNNKSPIKLNIKDNRGKNIITRLVIDPDFIEYFNSLHTVDEDNTAGLTAHFIEKYGKCIIPKKISNYTLYQRVNIPVRFIRKHNLYRKYLSSHRLAYKIKYPSRNLYNIDIDHKCHNPHCCNPDHLRALTRSENSIEKGERAFLEMKNTLKIIEEKDEFTKWLKIIKKAAVNFDYSGEYKTRIDDDHLEGLY